jgi:5-formyltetrahydrofolate cyclo-ligase
VPFYNKQSLREHAYARRIAIPPPERDAAAQRVRDNFLKFIPLQKGTLISAYVPMKSEMSPLPLFDALIELGYTVLMPRVIPNHTLLEFRTWDRTTPMIRSIYGIEEPDPLHSAVSIPDVFLMPLLAFDKEGHRLGYGAGYYDQTFGQMKGKMKFQAVGIAYELQCYDSVPFEMHDYPLDMCITEQKFHDFRRAA